MGKTNRRHHELIKFFGAISIAVVLSLPVQAAWLWFEPFKADLPDGSTLNLFVSGDEFFNWAHDSQGFPVKKGADGYFYYMIQNDTIFSYTRHRVGETNPLLIPGMKKTVFPSNTLKKREAFYKAVEAEDLKNKVTYDGKWSGTFNNLIIYIKFSDQTEFPTTSRAAYDALVNSVTNASVRHYYREISYDNLDMVSYHMPGGPTGTVSYTDTYTRAYFSPYNASTNPTGYSTDSEKTTREHALLARAAKYIDDNYSKPEGVNFDTNNDGRYDNVAFIVKGTSDGWSDLLWPHRWSLYSQTATLWGKRVYGYTLQLENVSVKTFTHEMFHALGAPDLYHYESTGAPVGTWDLMASGGGHPTAWMKSKYGGWIESIPEITQTGTYSIKPLTESTKNAFIIKSPLSTNQFFVVEFRKKSGLYETKLPSSGLIIMRVDTRYRGNAQGPPDELYVYRPYGTLESEGTINQATFSDLNSRTVFSDFTNPAAFFQEGSLAGIYISNITWHNDSMTFRVDLDKPANLTVAKTGNSQLQLNWASIGTKPFLVAASKADEVFVPSPAMNYSAGSSIGTSGTIAYKGSAKTFVHTGLESDELYNYTIWSIIDESSGIYSDPLRGSGRTGVYLVSTLPYSEDFSTAIPGKLPQGWKAQGGDDQWNIQSVADFSPPNSILIKNLGAEGALFYTPGFYLQASKKYQISFRYRSAAGPAKESIFLHAGKDRYDGSLNSNILFTNSSVPQNDYVISRTIFTPSESSEWYFAINSGTGGQGVFIDDFKIEAVSSSSKNLTEPVNFFPNPATSYIIIPAREKTTVTIYNNEGKVVLSQTIEGTRDIDVSKFVPGSYYIRFTNKRIDKTSKLIILGTN